MVESPPCRTTTPLGRPVVPEVYMMSATSSGPNTCRTSVSSGARRSSQRSELAAEVLTTVGTASRNSACTSLHSSTDAPAWKRIRDNSDGPSLARRGTATAPALWMAR